MNGNDYDLDFTIKKPTRKSYKDNLNGGIAKFINLAIPPLRLSL